MKEEEIRAEIAQNKERFRRIQAQLPFAEKVRIAFELSKRRMAIKHGRIVVVEGDPTIRKPY